MGINAHYDDELSDGEVEGLKSVIGRLEGRIADDLLDAAAIDMIASDANWIEDAHERALGARRTSFKNVRVRRSMVHSPDRYTRTAYAAGYRQASAFRESTGLGIHSVPDLEDLMRRLGWAEHSLGRHEHGPFD